MVLPSQRTIDFIVECEVSSRSYYEKHYTHPEWPGGRSGVTIGIGYDLGYASTAKINHDWGTRVSSSMLASMLQCSGISGDAARSMLPHVRSEISIPWADADAVFMDVDIPEYTDGLLKAIPAAAKLPPDCLGVLDSIAYNRGNGGWTAAGDRYREMRQIKGHVEANQWEFVSHDIVMMQRLWPSDQGPDKGLRARRVREAALWDAGLRSSDPPARGDARTPEAPPRTLPGPGTGAAGRGTTGGLVATTAGAAKDAADAGWSSGEIAMLAAGGLVLAAGAYYLIKEYRARSSPTLARAKDYPQAAPAAA